MKKKLLALALALIPMLGFSQHRSESEAITVAQEFWGKGVNRTKLKAVSQKSMAKAKARIAKAAPATGSSKQSFYVVNDDAHNRFVIVSADERLYKILGYSDNGTFNPETAPAGLLDMMNGYDEQYSSVYDALETGVKGQKKAYAYTAVLPMIDSKWGQSDPYNMKCPKDVKSLDGDNCATGCVATAMAQVMNFYKYPEGGVGSNSYISDTYRIEQNLDFSSVRFDWTNIINEYGEEATEDEKSAVATLMHAAGVSVSMDYADESGAYAIDMAYALSHFWNYNTNIAYKKKQYYSDETWNQMIQEELQAGHPILYAGSGGSGGHQFVLDGCNEDGLYHFNFGWKGNGDGYYSLEVLAPFVDIWGLQIPLGDYSSRQEMVCYVTPEVYGKKSGEFYASSSLGLTTQKVGDKKLIVSSIYNCDSYSAININGGVNFTGEIGVGLFDKDFQFVKSLGQTDASINAGYCKTFLEYVNFDAATFADGKQYYIAFYTHSNELGYSIARTEKGMEDYYLATVKDGYVVFDPMKQMGTSAPEAIEVVTGLYNATTTCPDGSTVDWQISMWQDESDATKYWIANLDPVAVEKGYAYEKGWNKVYGFVNATGTKLSIPVNQTIGNNILLRSFSGNDALVLYLAPESKSMTIESAWGCEEVDYSSENVKAKEFSHYNAGRFVYTTEKIDDVVVDVASPQIVVSDNHILTMSCTTDNVSLYYTLDGSEPSAYSSAYTSPVQLTGNCTVKAIAIYDGKASEISTYSVSDFICASPIISQKPNSNEVVLSTDTEGASIFYTIDGSAPNEESQLYEQPLEITRSCVIKAIAVKKDYNDSPIVSQTASYYPPVPVPTDVFVLNNVAGELSSHVSALEKETAASWTITGELNGTDVAFLREVFKIGKITDLDLGNAIIVSGGEPYYKTTYTEYSTEDNVVGTNMFKEAKSLISLVLPSTTLRIDSYSVQNCDNLATIAIPEFCKEVEGSAIYFCDHLTSIQIGKNLEEFGSMNGSHCPVLKTISVDAENGSFVSVDGILYSKEMDVLYKYPSGRTDISFSVPSTVVTLGDYAFSNATFESVNLPEGLKVINTGAFDGCKKLRSIEMPQTVEEIGMFAFQNCAKFTAVTIPDHVKQLKSFAFGYCVGLRDFHVGAAVSKIDGSAFVGSTSLQAFTVANENNVFAAEGGILYSKDLKTIVRCPLALYADEIILGDEIEDIAPNAFQDCQYIKKFRLPEGLKEIGSSAFDGCTMEAISVPNSVEKMGMFAFQDCANLKDFAIPASVHEIPEFMLANCDALEYLYIHKDVTSIDSYAFTRAENLSTIECWIEDISDLEVAEGYFGGYTPFLEIKEDCVWHVPVGLADAYTSQDWWISTWNIIDDLIPSGMDNVLADSDFEVFPGNQSVEIVSLTDRMVNIYNLQGCLLKAFNVNAGQKTTVALPTGIYLINRNKVSIK